MPIIRPSSDLRNNYNEISTICHQTKSPVYITKNGAGDLAVMSIELYELLTEKYMLRMILLYKNTNDYSRRICRFLFAVFHLYTFSHIRYNKCSK